MFNILLEASPLDNGVPTTVRMSSAAVLSDGVQVDEVEWLPVITTVPDLGFGISEGGGAASPMSISMGGVSFRIGKRYGNREWNTLSWVGAPATAWIGVAGKPLSSYRRFFTGTLSGLARTGAIAELALRTVEGQLDVPLLSKRYAGTGGPEGPAGKKGTLKPYCVGNPRIVAPVEVDPALLIYQVHGYGPVRDIPTVYEFGQTLAPSKGDAVDFAALAAADLKPGEWITCRALGMFRLGGRPDKKLAADVLGAGATGSASAMVSSVVPLLLQEAGVSAQRIGSMSALDFAWCFYATEQTTILETVRKAALDAGAYVFPDLNGVWQCGRHRDEKPATALRVDRTSEPLVQTINELNVADPTWKVEVAYDPCWNVHDESDISPKLIELEGKINARDEVLDELMDEAQQAAADAAFARAEMTTILADGVLDRSDKRRAVAHLERQRTQHRRLEGVYQAYSVAAQWDAYHAAWIAAETYMLALSPSIYDDQTDTPVNRDTYLAVWATYDAALKLLFDTIIGRTVGVPGTAPIGGVVGPDGTITGGKPATEVLHDVEDSKALWKKLPDLVGPLLQKPIDDLSALHIGYGASLLKASTALNKKNLVAIEEIGTRVEADGSLVAEKILNLTSRVDAADAAVIGVNGAIEAGLLRVDKTIANLDFASAETVTTMIANYGKDVTAAFNEERRVRAEANKAFAEDISQMDVRLTKDIDGVKTTMEGTFNDLRELIVDGEANSALAQRIDEMGVRITTEIGDEKTLREAAIKSVEKAFADSDEAFAERVDTLSSSVTNITKDGGVISVLSSTIEDLQQTVVDNDGARAEDVKKVQSRLDNFNGVTGASVEQAIKTAVDAAGKAGASYVLKVQSDQNGQKYIAGMGVAIEDGVSAIAFSADSFRLTTPGANPQQVFYADANGVYMPNVRVDKLSVGAMDGEFNANKQAFNGTEGTQMLPGGVVMKWGKYRGGIFDEGVVTVNFVTPFPISCDAFVPTPYLATFRTDRDLWLQNVGEPSRFGATLGAQAATKNDQRIDGFDWIAFGR